MGDVKIAYYVVKGGDKPGTRRMGYWAPCLARPNKKTKEFEPTLMAKLGFKHIECGEDGPQAWAIAESWNKKWKAARAASLAGQPPDAARQASPATRVNSVAEGYAKFRATSEWQRKKPRTREDWERGWKLIEPVFGDADPRTLDLMRLDQWYAGLLELVGVREAHRAMKIWRALWKRIATIKRADGEAYCTRDADPSLGVTRKTPQPRAAFWFAGEAVRLVKRAVRMRYAGLAAALAVAWDSQLSPVDVVSLTKGKLSDDGSGALFSLDRTKTGRAAIATLSRRGQRVLDAYLASLPENYHPDAPIFLTRGAEPGPKGGRPRPPVPYTVDKLGKDFAVVRAAQFPGDRRQLGDFRRSGAVEHDAGAGDDKALAKKMGNTVDRNRALRDTYVPPGLAPDASVVRLADQARLRGRARLRDARGGK